MMTAIIDIIIFRGLKPKHLCGVRLFHCFVDCVLPPADKWKYKYKDRTNS